MLLWSWLAQQDPPSAEVRARLRQPKMDFELRPANGTEGVTHGTAGTHATVSGTAHVMVHGRAHESAAPQDGQQGKQAYWISPIKYHGNEAAAHIANPTRPGTMAFTILPSFPTRTRRATATTATAATNNTGCGGRRCKDSAPAEGKGPVRWGCRVRSMQAVAKPGDPRNTPVLNATTLPAAPVAVTHSDGLTLAITHVGGNPSTSTTHVVHRGSSGTNGTNSSLRFAIKHHGPPSNQTVPTTEWVQAAFVLDKPLNLNGIVIVVFLKALVFRGS